MSRAVGLSALALAVTGASCALTFPDYEAEPEGSTSTGAGGSGGEGGSGAGGSDSPFVADACMPGTFATGVTPEGKLVCMTIDAATVDAVNEGCTVYAGWKDACNSGCLDPPMKWGSVGAASCYVGPGTNDTCQTPILDGSTVQLFGLNTDGVVNSDDKFYYGFSCTAGSTSTKPGPCGPGEFLQGYDGVTPTCVTASGAILSFVSSECSLYFGVRDQCNASCTSAPARWGNVSSNDCDEGSGTPNTCITAMLDKEVRLIGVNTNSTPVDGDNKFYVALDCRPPAAETTSVPGVCPAGKLIVGIEADGTLLCASPAPEIATAFGAHCTLYSGWKDQCQGGCLGEGQTPSKWGRVRVGACANQQGNDSTCQDSILGGVMVRTFGLNTDGFVSESDKFFTGFACQ